jgi:hypothetical protein
MINPLSLESMLRLRGGALVDRNGVEVGSISDVYYDRETRVPEWVGVTRSFWGGQLVLVPVFEAETRGNVLSVPYDRSAIESAPQVDAREIDEGTERRLYEHYGISYSRHTSSTGLPAGVDVSTEDSSGGDMRAHVATRWSWPDEPAASPMAGTPERLAEESRMDSGGVTGPRDELSSETVSPETMAPFPKEPEAATAPDNAPGPPRTGTHLGSSQQQPARSYGEPRSMRDEGRRALDQEAVVMSDKPADLPGTLYDTSPDGMQGGARTGTRVRNAAITMSALGAGLLFLRQMRRRRHHE